jgi:NADH dehydrogenase
MTPSDPERSRAAPGAARGAAAPHRIVVVGGGAGGLELATRLGDSLGRGGRASVTLIDRSATHMWKPLLHEVAAGSIDTHAHQLEYLAQAHWHHFSFRLGAVVGLDRERRIVHVDAVNDEDGEPMLPKREIGYDALIFAVGGVTHDFGTPGVREHAFVLDSAPDAERFHRKLLAACVRADAASAAGNEASVGVTVVGAGATGVELAAELRVTTRVLASYGLAHFEPRRQVRLTLVEGAPRILPPLPERVADATAGLLRKLHVDVLTGEKVTEVTDAAVFTASGHRIPSDLVVWTAGVKAPDWLRGFGGLATNRANQIVVGPTLASVTDPNVFAIGDCAQAPWTGERSLPPLAQVAHQQASHLARMMRHRLQGKPLRPFRYRNYGSLVSLGGVSAVGNLMGGLIGGSVFVEGLVARFMYVQNYTLHLAALHGWLRVLLAQLGRFLRERTEPRVKLH